jgi:hypothetical protein
MKLDRRCFSVAVFALGMFILPAGATIIDLTTSHTASGNIGQCVGVATDDCGFWVNVDAQSTGTGVIDPFYTVQHTGTEQGFNTDAPGASPNYDMKRANGSAFTQAIQVSDFGLVDIDGNPCNGCLTPYIRFALDINEAGGGDQFLSVDSLQLWVKTYNDIVSTTLATLTADAVKIYDLDGLNNDVIYTDYSLNSGSGSGDVILYVPYAAFAGHTTDWLYLYGHYGSVGALDNPTSPGCDGTTLSMDIHHNCDYQSSSGFEEWARLEGPNGVFVPEPVSSVLIGTGLVGIFFLRRRIRG